MPTTSKLGEGGDLLIPLESRYTALMCGKVNFQDLNQYIKYHYRIFKTKKKSEKK